MRSCGIGAVLGIRSMIRSLACYCNEALFAFTKFVK